MIFGIQSFGTRDIWSPDREKFFETIRSWGYRQFEPCVSFAPGRDMSRLHVFAPEEVTGLAETLDRYGIGIPSIHVFTEDPAAALPELLRVGKAIGLANYVFPCPREMTAEAYLAYAEVLKQCAAALKEAGIGVLVHNGGKDPTGVKLGGKTAYEFLLDACGGLVGMQPDLGWVYAGGEDPEAFLWRNEDRVLSLHYKDMKAGETPTEAPLGKGDLDNFACFQFARAHGIPHIVDMDVCTMEDIEAAGKLLSGMPGKRERTRSILCTLDVDTGELTELHRFDGVIEAPNWTKDGKALLYNAGGLIYRYALDRDEISQVNTGMCTNCNNDHVLSPDGKYLGVSHMTFDEKGFSSKVYIVDPETGDARLVTENSPSFLHGWSPDGREMAYCAFRQENGRRVVDVYTVPAEGGGEKRLTFDVGYSDGPEYSPDGKQIWYNTTKSGLMQAWRMDRDGSAQVQMTDNEANNWFPHISPDGRQVVYLSFRKGDLEPHEHLPNMRVQLWKMDADGANKQKLLDFFGGQGSINVNSWSPDSKRVALVTYELEHK